MSERHAQSLPVARRDGQGRPEPHWRCPLATREGPWACQNLMVSGSNPVPAPDEDVWWNGLRWVEAAHMQVARFEEAFFEEVRALTDVDLRFRLNNGSDLSRS